MTLPTPAAPPVGERSVSERTMWKISASAAFIIGLSVFLSFQWWSDPPTFRADAPNIIMTGIGVAAIIAIIIFFAGLLARIPAMKRRFCPQCGRQIPFDSILCPYCGQRLP